MIAVHAALLAQQERPAGEDHLRPRRGHGGDDQAPPVAHAPPHGRSRARDASSRSTSTSSSTAARTPRSRRSCSRAGASTPPGPTTSTTSASAPAPSPRTRRPTAPSAASARRSRSSPSSGTSTSSRVGSACRPRSCAAATSSARARRSPPARSCATTSTWARMLDRALTRERLARPARALRRRERARRAACGAGWASRRSSTARASPARARSTWRRSSAPRARPTGGCACSPPAPRSARARTPSSRRSPPTRWASGATTSRSPRPTRATSPTAGPRSRRARARSSASSSSRRRAPLKAQLARRAALLAEPYDAAAFRAACARFVRERGQPARHGAVPAAAGTSSGTTSTFRGDAYGAYSWAVYVAQVAVDTITYEARVEELLGAAGGGQGHPPPARRRADRGRRRAGDRLGALRERRLEGRPHGQRPHDRLHRADERRRAAHPRRSSRSSPYARRPRRARRASASCRWTGPRPPSSTPSPTRRALGLAARAGHARGGVRRRWRPRPVADVPPIPFRVNGASAPRACTPCDGCSTCCARTSSSPAPRRAAARASAAHARCWSTAASSTRASCPVAQVRGREVTTIEGLATGATLGTIQRAFIEHGGAQCGICTPGMILAARELLDRVAVPDEADDPRGARRQHLPLHRLHAHLRERRARHRARAGRRRAE